MNKGKAKRTASESLAALAQLIGAFVLVAGLVPIINPGMYKVHTGRSSPDFLAMAIPVALGLVLIAGGRVCQRQIKSDSPAAETLLQKKLKWIIFGILAVIVLLTFLW